MSTSLGLSIRHHTGFTYEGLAKASYNEARMTPVSTPDQEVSASRLRVTPAAALWTYRDYFSTLVTAFDIQEPHAQLEVEANSVVESRAARRAAPISWSELRDERLLDVFSEYLFESHRTAWSGGDLEGVEEWRGARDVHECAQMLSAFVRDRVRYVPGATTVSSTAQEAWDRGEGVCQDITHITIGALRGVGVPARYVSGYLYPAHDAEVGVPVDGQSHAWVEYFAGAWTGIDPTNDSGQTERHIIVGTGRDYDDVAPLKGVYQGPASASLGVVVEMTRTH